MRRNIYRISARVGHFGNFKTFVFAVRHLILIFICDEKSVALFKRHGFRLLVKRLYNRGCLIILDIRARCVNLFGAFRFFVKKSRRVAPIADFFQLLKIFGIEFVIFLFELICVTFAPVCLNYRRNVQLVFYASLNFEAGYTAFDNFGNTLNHTQIF